MKNSILIKNIDELVKGSGFKAKKGEEMSHLHIVEDGAIYIEDGIIKTLGKNKDILNSITGNAGTVIDAKGKAVLPGFVDSHTHFVFGGYRQDEFIMRLSGADYMDIMKKGGGILSTVRATRESSKKNLIQLGLKRLDTMLAHGVTTVEGKSGYGLDCETEIKQLEVMKELNRIHPVDVVPTFLGAHAVPEDFKSKGDAYIDLIINEVLPEVSQRGLAEFCDIFCEKNVFSISQSRKLLTKAIELGLKIKIHADEMVPLGGAELSASLGAISADHLLCISDQGISDMRDKNVIATLLPGTAFCLKEKYARAREMIDKNLAVALATDFNPGSCFTLSIPFIIALSTFCMDMTIEEAITALTINGAAALSRADKTGSLDIGKQADIIILEYPSYKFIPYHTGVNCVEKVIKNGQLVYNKET